MNYTTMLNVHKELELELHKSTMLDTSLDIEAIL